ncbi:MAG: PIN domain-containing protein [Rhodospirillaceae bacterium]|nr:PIN domain-containing protein [Rhodospirillaceae bacterium]
MTGPSCFVDTNVLVYAHDTHAGEKKARAETLLQDLWATNSGRLSTQVLQELYVSITRKLAAPVGHAKAREILDSFGSWVRVPTTVGTVLRASDLAELAKISFWDALIVAAAEEAGASILYSEDLNDGQVLAGVKIVNPFKAGALA